MDSHNTLQKPSKFKTSKAASSSEVEYGQNDNIHEKRLTKESLQFTEKQIEILNKRWVI
jgi:hypothetical protein